LKRRKAALIILPAALILVLAVGLTRGTNDDTEDPAPGEDDNAADVSPAWLQPDDEVIEVGADEDCKGAGEGDNVACQGYQVADDEVAWLVEQDGAGAPVASMLRRTSPTSFTRILRVDGADGDTRFERVNVRIDDVTADGGVEAIFGYHQDNDMSVDIVDPSGVVLAHLDLGAGQMRVEDGKITTWKREDDGWLLEELAFNGAVLEIVTSEHIPGPAEGNL
jgi:hypothetical protein